MPHHERPDRYGILVYKDQPVANQYRHEDEICVTFCNGKAVYVSLEEWLEHKRFVLVPRSLGTRDHIVRHWHEHLKVCDSSS